jgi:hypothetical protein
MRIRSLGAVTLLWIAVSPAACAGGLPGSGAPPARWEALSDTTLCVVDRTSSTGLTNLPARVESDGRVVLLENRRIVPVEQVHPVSLLAGYAGREPWVSSAAPVTHAGRRYVHTGGERRVPIDLLRRVGDHQGVPLFASPEEATPEAVYVPLRPGCVFQAYVRSDLL